MHSDLTADANKSYLFICPRILKLTVFTQHLEIKLHSFHPIAFESRSSFILPIPSFYFFLGGGRIAPNLVRSRSLSWTESLENRHEIFWRFLFVNRAHLSGSRPRESKLRNAIVGAVPGRGSRPWPHSVPAKQTRKELINYRAYREQKNGQNLGLKFGVASPPTKLPNAPERPRPIHENGANFSLVSHIYPSKLHKTHTKS